MNIQRHLLTKVFLHMNSEGLKKWKKFGNCSNRNCMSKEKKKNTSKKIKSNPPFQTKTNTKYTGNFFFPEIWLLHLPAKVIFVSKSWGMAGRRRKVQRRGWWYLLFLLLPSSIPVEKPCVRAVTGQSCREGGVGGGGCSWSGWGRVEWSPGGSAALWGRGYRRTPRGPQQRGTQWTLPRPNPTLRPLTLTPAASE